jgi:hypothetical protein
MKMSTSEEKPFLVWNSTENKVKPGVKQDLDHQIILSRNRYPTEHKKFRVQRVKLGIHRIRIRIQKQVLVNKNLKIYNKKFKFFS